MLMRIQIPTFRRQSDIGYQQPMPPSPGLMLELYARWKGLIRAGRLGKDLSFENYFSVWSSGRRSHDFAGLDDGNIIGDENFSRQLIYRPKRELVGIVPTLVLLVDFQDRPHGDHRTSAFYEQMLFGDLDVFPAGSMAEYYRRISNYDPTAEKGIDIQGKVYGWLRMPQLSSYYTSGNSGLNDYPHNAQGLAEDAVHEAIRQGISFSGYDALGEGIVTALCIIHSGRGAENTGSKDDIWSQKSLLRKRVEVGGGLTAATFLTVPEDCQIGVCAHEWGHLAARWGDYYDTGESESTRSNGLGDYCLMASGAWNNCGITPCLPNGMLRMFHKWIDVDVVTHSRTAIVLKPAAEGGGVVAIRNESRMTGEGQYVIVEYRRRVGQDLFLPDEGLAIYYVDESVDDVNNEHRLAIELMQVDNRRDLARIFGTGNPGDLDDLYPGKIDDQAIDFIGQDTSPSLKNLNGDWTGISIRVRGLPGDDEMEIDVEITP